MQGLDGKVVEINLRVIDLTGYIPDEMRGRASAVNGIFISASNELGGFESGAVAALQLQAQVEKRDRGELAASMVEAANRLNSIRR